MKYSKLIQDLNYCELRTSEKSWDDEGAAVIPPARWKDAHTFLNWMLFKGFVLPKGVVPCGDGSIHWYWLNEKGSIELESGANGDDKWWVSITDWRRKSQVFEVENVEEFLRGWVGKVIR